VADLAITQEVLKVVRIHSLEAVLQEIIHKADTLHTITRTTVHKEQVVLEHTSTDIEVQMVDLVWLL
jgi:hypothetical protein